MCWLILRLQFYILWVNKTKIYFSSQISYSLRHQRRRGGTPEHRLRNRKNCCRKLVSSSMGVYTLGKEAEIQEIFSKNMKKFNLPQRFWSKNIKVFLKNFKLSSFLVQTLKVLQRIFLLSLPSGNYPSNVNYFEFLHKLQSIFSKIYKNFHPIFNGSSISKPVLSFLINF